jgi:molecular chaperone DnaJ
MTKDFYLVLQVTRSATRDEIHSAYQRRASELHPDRSASDSEPFIELQKAYSVLSDLAQRTAYDRGRESLAVRRGGGMGSRPASAEPFREIEPVSDFREVSLSQSFHTFAPSFDELFDRLWSNFDLLTRPKAEGLESLTVDVPLSQQEASAGGSVRILVPARLTCRACNGRGSIGFYQCWRCRGQGTMTAEFPLEVAYPTGLRRDYLVRVPLDEFGIHNFYLTVRFRLTDLG